MCSGEVTKLFCILAVACSLNYIYCRCVTGNIDWQLSLERCI